MLYKKSSELTREDMDIDHAKIEFVKQEFWAKADKKDGNNVQWLLDGRDAMFEEQVATFNMMINNK